MPLHSPAFSTRLEVITSKRLTSFIYAVFGTSIVVWWIAASIQFISAYFTLHQFDISIDGFIGVTLLLFGPLVLSGTFMLAILIQRVRLQNWFKNMIDYPLYDISLRPAEAGIIVDYAFSQAEIHATLLDLHFRDVLLLSLNGTVLTVKLQATNTYLSEYEKAFLSSLFTDSSEVQLSTLFSPRLLRAGEQAHQALLHELGGLGEIPHYRQRNKVLSACLKVIFFIGGVVGLFNIYVYITDYTIATQVAYPRYAVVPLELWTLYAVSIAAIALMLSGFWPRFDFNRHSALAYVWLQARGFKDYLEAVYKTRLDEEHFITQDRKTIQKLLPFMLAYRIVPLSTEFLRKLL